MKKVTITINNKEVEVPSGLVSGKDLYAVAECGEQCLYLNREDKIDIPVSKDDFIVIRGEEEFITGKSDEIEDNPPLRNSVCPEFNGKKEGLSLPMAKNFGKELKSKDDKFPEGRLFIDLPDAVDKEIHDDMRLIVQNQDSYFVIPPLKDADGYVDVEECVKYETRVPRGQKYRVRIDGEKYTINEMVITGAAILALVSKVAGEWTLNQKIKGGERRPIATNTAVDLSICGVERFETVRNAQQQGNE